MAATPKPVVRKDGSIVYRVHFRLRPGGAPTTETFDYIDQAWKFSELVDKVGGEAARKIRDASDRSNKSAPTMREVFEQHLVQLEGSATKGTIYGYKGVSERTWLQKLADLPIDQVTTDMVEEWVTWQRKQPSRKGGKYSSKSIKNAHGILSSVFEAQVRRRDGWVSHNPAKGVTLPTDDAVTREMTIITPNHYAKLIGHIPEQWQPLIAPCTAPA